MARSFFFGTLITLGALLLLPEQGCAQLVPGSVSPTIRKRDSLTVFITPTQLIAAIQALQLAQQDTFNLIATKTNIDSLGTQVEAKIARDSVNLALVGTILTLHVNASMVKTDTNTYVVTFKRLSDSTTAIRTHYSDSLATLAALISAIGTNGVWKSDSAAWLGTKTDIASAVAVKANKTDTTLWMATKTELAALRASIDSLRTSSTDIIRPGPIASLVIDSTTTTSAYLRWTAVGDDSLTGTADHYVIKYGTRYITDGDIITNRSFESNITGWSFAGGGGSFAWSTAQAHGGLGSGQLIMAQEDLYPWVGWNITATAADTVYFSFWARADENLTIDPLVLDQSYTIIGGSSPVSLTAGTWTYVSRTVYASGVQSMLRVGFNPDPGIDGASVWIDDASCIIGTTWSVASTASSPPTPVAAGGTQVYTLTGLTPAATYYASIKTYDERDNASAMSNVVKFVASTSGETEGEGIPVLYAYDKYVSPTGSRSNPGTYASPWNIATLNDSLGCRAGLDSIALLPGVYTEKIAPTYSGTYSQMLYIGAYGGGVCSLYTAQGAIELNGVDYIKIENIRMRTAPTSISNVVMIYDAHWNWLNHVRMYGGSTFNNPATMGVGNAVEIDTSNYNRITRSYLDRLDTNISADENRGEGFYVSHSSYYNVLEQDTAVHVSHFAFVVPRGSAYNQDEISMRHATHNVVRNCVAFDGHVGFGSTDYADWVLMEGNKAFAMGQACNYRDGLAFEGTSRNGLYRYNMFWVDSIPLGGGALNIEVANSISEQSWGGTNYNNRYIFNYFGGGDWQYGDIKGAFTIADDTGDIDSLGLDQFVNNIFDQRGSYGTPLQWTDPAFPDTIRTSILWGQEPGDTVALCNPGGPKLLSDIIGAVTHGVYVASSVTEASPLFADSVSRGLTRSFALSAGSPARNAAEALTAVASNTSDAKVVNVGDTRYFYFNYGGSPFERGDSILIGTTRAEIDSIDHVNNRIVTAANVTVTAGSPIHILRTWSTVLQAYINRFLGALPDIGPVEYQE